MTQSSPDFPSPDRHPPARPPSWTVHRGTDLRRQRSASLGLSLLGQPLLGLSLLLLLSGAAPLLAREARSAASQPNAETEERDGERLERRLEAAWAFAEGKLLADAGQFEEALEAYERSVELDADDPYNLIEVARFHTYLAQISRTRQQQLGYLEEALLYVDRAREKHSDNADVLELFAQTHMRLAEEKPISIALAQGAWEHLLELDPENLGALTSLGQIYLWNQEGEKAARVLREASRFSPRNRMIQGMLVEALLGTGKSEDAESALVHMVQLEPDNVEHRIRLAELLAERNDHAGAVEVLEGAPDDDWFGSSRIDQMLAREYHLAGRHAEALKLTDELLTAMVGSMASEGFLRLRSAILAAMLRYEEAIETFLPVLAALDDPEQRARDALLVARLYERIGQDGEAVSLLRRQLDSAEGTTRIRLLMALSGTHQRAGQLAEARTLLESIDLAEPSLAGDSAALVTQGLAEILYEMELADEALAVLAEGASARRAVSSSENDTAADSIDNARLAHALELRRAVLLADLEKWPAVEKLALQISEADAPGVRLAGRQFLADAYASQGKLDAALAQVEPTDDEPSSRQLLAKRFQLLFDHGRQDQARRELEERAAPALARLAPWKRSPSMEEGSAEPGDGETQAEEPASAEKTASASDPAPAEEEAAESEAEELPAEARASLDEVFFVAQVYQRQELYADAVPLLETVVEVQPDGINALFALGASYERAGSHERATRTFEQLLELRPSHAPTLNYLAYMWAERGENLERALDMTREAVSADPDNGAYVDSLGWAYFRLGRYEEARPHLEWAARLEPDDPTVFEHLGDLYVALDDRARARAAYLRASSLYQDEGSQDGVDTVERKLAALDAEPPEGEITAAVPAPAGPGPAVPDRAVPDRAVPNRAAPSVPGR